MDVTAGLPPKAPTLWLAMHVPSLLGSYLLLAGAFFLGVLFLIQDWMLKHRPATTLLVRLPPLETLDTWIYRLILIAFPLLSLGILLGGHWAKLVWGRFWGWDAKETFTLVTWLVYGACLVMRGWGAWRGRKSTYLSLAGFVLIVLTYEVATMFSQLHRFKGP